MQEIVNVLCYKAALCEDGEEFYGPCYGMIHSIYISRYVPSPRRVTLYGAAGTHHDTFNVNTYTLGTTKRQQELWLP